MTDVQLKELWVQFGDTPINDDDEIECDFLHFEAGTDRFEIWQWFDEKHSKGLVKGLIEVEENA